MNTVVARIKSALGNQQILLLTVWVAMVAFFTARNSVFFSTSVFGNILSDWSPVVLIAIGETFVIISGGIDLSVGSTVGVSGVVGAIAMEGMTNHNVGQNSTLIVGFLVTLGVGLIVGIINALMITKAKVVPFIATLVTMGAGAGLSICLLYTSDAADE